MASEAVVAFSEVLRARKQIAPHLPRTPLYSYPALERLIGTEVLVKHENHQPVGAFKVRGGVNLISQLPDDERVRGVIAASTGNHGQSIAYAARLFGVKAVICAPAGANPYKVEAMRDLGAEVILHGRTYDQARERAEELARERGYRYVHSGDEPLLIAGVATIALEILEDAPDVDVLIVPIGGGSGAAGACLVKSALKPELQVIGVQSAASPAAHQAWTQGAPAVTANETVAEGLATGTSFDLPQRILRDALDEFALVSDAEILGATAAMIRATRNLVEPAGAAALAAATKLSHRLAGRRVALVCSGGNLGPSQLAEIALRLNS